MNPPDRIEQFLDGAPHAVIGASLDRSKYGNKVLRAYLQANRTVFPVNPKAEIVEGLKAYSSLTELPEAVHGISIITPPEVTRSVIEQAGTLGIQNVWMQPGAESDVAIGCATQLGMNVIAGGPCILVALGYRQ
jgi:predicted CoA-binding protein